MSAGRVVHCKREPFDVYIGRPSKWGNPFPLPKGYDVHADPDRILARYEEHVRSRPDLMASLSELHGKVLACWCAPNPCHGDVLLRMADEIARDPHAYDDPLALKDGEVLRDCGCRKPRRLSGSACWYCGETVICRPDRIEGPAIRDPRGVVYTLPTPASHHAVSEAIKAWKPDATPLKWDQGFVTETGRYVDRREGKRIAEEAGQIVRPTGGTDRLFSEELWVKEGKES